MDWFYAPILTQLTSYDVGDTKPLPELMLTYHHRILCHSFQGIIYLNIKYINPHAMLQI